MHAITLFSTYSQMISTAGLNDQWAHFEGPDGQTVLLYFSDLAQCDPFGLTSAPSFTSTTTTQTNMDLPAPDVEDYKGGNTSACYQQLLQVIAANSGGGETTNRPRVRLPSKLPPILAPSSASTTVLQSL